MRATPRSLIAAAALITASWLVLGCSGRDASRAAARDSTAASPAPSSPASTAAGTSPASDSSGRTTVRGTLAYASDSALTVSTANGDVRVALAPPVAVYARVPADLSRVTDESFVGVTSVPGPDGTQRATEIHIFPEELRGTAEGSFLLPQQGGVGSRSTMTNGTVAAPAGPARMTNGAARMTNGAVRGQTGATLTVTYRGGSQTITVPPGVTVTAITRTQAKLARGSGVVVLAVKRPDGTLQASRVLLARGAGPK